MPSYILKSVSLFLFIAFPFSFIWGQWEYPPTEVERILKLKKEKKISILDQKFEISDSLDVNFDITTLSQFNKTIYLEKIEIHTKFLVVDDMRRYSGVKINPMVLYNVNRSKVIEDSEIFYKDLGSDALFIKTKAIEAEPRLAFKKNEPARYLLTYSLELEKFRKIDIKKGVFYFVMHFSNGKTIITTSFEKDFEKGE
ncbi:MAG: hypothetical protein AAFO07_32815 [Bacteroidota bacterium]